jgi:hypothetical protein
MGKAKTPDDDATPAPGKSPSASKQSGTEERRQIIEEYINSLKELLKRLRHICRSTSIFLISAMALAGLRSFGQTLAQFMMVWQR